MSNLGKNYSFNTFQDEPFFVGDACNKGKNEVWGSYLAKSSKAGVLCCKFDGTSCRSVRNKLCPTPDVKQVDAEVQCATIGHRLCSKNELLNGICCEAIRNCNSNSIWTLTSKSGGIML